MRFSRHRITILSFQRSWVSRLMGANIGGWYDIIRLEFCEIASSRTGGVRSLVRRIFSTLWGAVGSTNKPTLSQLPASVGWASLLSLGIQKDSV